MCVEGDLIGRLVLELYRDLCPRTADNFVCLCTGERGTAEETGTRLSYVNSLIHRVVPGGWVQGGGKGKEGGMRGRGRLPYQIGQNVQHHATSLTACSCLSSPVLSILLAVLCTVLTAQHSCYHVQTSAEVAVMVVSPYMAKYLKVCECVHCQLLCLIRDCLVWCSPQFTSMYGQTEYQLMHSQLIVSHYGTNNVIAIKTED